MIGTPSPSGLRGAPGYSLEQAHHLPIEMDPLIGQCTKLSTADFIGFIIFGIWDDTGNFHTLTWVINCLKRFAEFCLGFFLMKLQLFAHIANNSGVNKRQITDLVDQSIQINTHCFVVTADNRYILVCGFWDKSFRVYSTETGGFYIIYRLS